MQGQLCIFVMDGPSSMFSWVRMWLKSFCGPWFYHWSSRRFRHQWSIDCEWMVLELGSYLTLLLWHKFFKAQSLLCLCSTYYLNYGHDFTIYYRSEQKSMQFKSIQIHIFATNVMAVFLQSSNVVIFYSYKIYITVKIASHFCLSAVSFGHSTVWQYRSKHYGLSS